MFIIPPTDDRPSWVVISAILIVVRVLMLRNRTVRQNGTPHNGRNASAQLRSWT